MRSLLLFTVYWVPSGQLFTIPMLIEQSKIQRPTPQQRQVSYWLIGVLAMLGIIGGIIGLVLAPKWWIALLILACVAALAGLGWNIMRRKQHEYDILQHNHILLDNEYTSLQTDYTTLERAFDDLQQSYGRLERRIDERTTEREQNTNQLQILLDETRSHASQLTALQEVSVALNSTLEHDEVLACILRQLERVVAFDSTSVYQLDGDTLQVVASRGLTAEVYDLKIDVATNDLAQRVLASDQPILLGNVQKESSWMMYPAPIRSWIGVALRVGDNTVGLLTIDHHQENFYSDDDARLVANFASQAALALHNSDVYAAAQRRAAETALLLEMTRTVGSTLHLPEVLIRAAAAIGEAMHAEDVLILLLDEHGEVLTPQAGAMNDTNYLRLRWSGTVELANEPTLAKVINQGCARVLHSASDMIPYPTLLALPLMLKEQVLGIVLVATPEGDRPLDSAQLILAEGLATSAAIAIEQARLYDHARRAAQMEERSRLARELHDSVTQTLFSMTLTAEAARAQIERNPARAAGQIDRLKAAAHQSLGEMRELLLQLRPTPLQEQGLARSLREHIETLKAHDVEIVLDIQGDDQRLNAQLSQGLYRITQEAISNALRHGKPTCINVTLHVHPHETRLRIGDDGCGFDPQQRIERGARHLGLTSMAERAAEFGGIFTLESAVGHGTTLSVLVKG